MALTEQTLMTLSVRAVEALVKNRFISFDGKLCSAGEKAFGVSIFDAEAGDLAGVVVEGKVIVEAGGAVTAGTPVTSDAEGKAVPATSASVTIPAGTADALAGTYNVDGGVLPEAINGYALTSATVAGELIEVLLK